MEMDVHRTRDGHLAVAHGRTVSSNLTLRDPAPFGQLPGVEGSRHSRSPSPSGADPKGAPLPSFVEDMTWQQVRRLDAGAWQGAQWAGEPVPELPALLRALWVHDVTLVVELKITHEKEGPWTQAGAPGAAGAPVAPCGSSEGDPGGARGRRDGTEAQGGESALPGARGRVGPGRASWDALVADSVLDLLFSAHLTLWQAPSGSPVLPPPASFSLLFSSFNHVLVDLIAAGIQRRRRERPPAGGRQPWLLLDALAGGCFVTPWWAFQGGHGAFLQCL